MAHEEMALQKIQDGELSIDDSGVIWRHWRRYKFIHNQCEDYVKNYNPSRKVGYKNKKGYLRFNLRENGKSYNIAAHRVVYLWFNNLESFPDNFREINHKDGNKANNSPNNLEFITRSENHRHAFKVLGKIGPRGSRNGKAKLSEGEVRNIIQLLKNHSISYVAKKYEVSPSGISLIKRNISWKHIPRNM